MALQPQISRTAQLRLLRNPTKIMRKITLKAQNPRFLPKVTPLELPVPFRLFVNAL